MTDENDIIKSNESQAEPISMVDLIYFAQVSPERWRAFSDEDKARWEASFRASGSPVGAHELAQGRRRK